MSRQPAKLALPTVITAVGVTGLLGLAGIGYRVVRAQADDAARRIEDAAIAAAAAAGAIPPGELVSASAIPTPDGDGVYLPAGRRTGVGVSGGGRIPAEDTFRFSIIGDSTSVGYGTSSPDELPGVLLARLIAADLDQPVTLTSHGRVGAVSAELDGQVDRALADDPALVVIVIGANDISDQVPPWRAAAQLGTAVRTLRDAGVEVVVATCPDFGVISPIQQPLRALVSRWSHRLATMQEKATVAAGGVAVSVGRLVSPEFRDRPDLFFADGFHPSAAGYARAVAGLRPEVLAAARRAAGLDQHHPDPQNPGPKDPD